MKATLLVLLALLALVLTACPSTNPDPAAVSRVQVIHALSGEPSVFVTANGTTPIARNLAFGSSGGYYDLAPGIQTLALSGNGTDVWMNQDITTDADSVYTLVVIGRTTTSVLFSDIIEPNPAQARVRFVNAAHGVFRANVITNIGPADYPIPGMQNVLFGTSGISPSTGSPFLNLPAGNYDLRFTADSSTTLLTTLPQQTFEAGKIYTLVLAGRQSDATVQAFLVPHQQVPTP